MDKEFVIARGWFVNAAERAGVDPGEVDRALALLVPLEVHHARTATHSLRVGMDAATYATILHDDARLAALGGAIHDCGKVCTPRRVLDATTLSPEDHRRYIVPHLELGYRMAQELLPEPAECMKHHHRFRSNPYPDVLPEPFEPYPRKRAAHHLRIGRLIALADYVDAMRTRVNDRFGNRPLTSEERLRFLRDENADVADDLERLLRGGAIRL